MIYKMLFYLPKACCAGRHHCLALGACVTWTVSGPALNCWVIRMAVRPPCPHACSCGRALCKDRVEDYFCVDVTEMFQSICGPLLPSAATFSQAREDAAGE